MRPYCTESESIALLRAVAKQYNVDGWWDWSEATTPRTERPARFNKGQHYVIRGGSVVRVARLGERSRVTF